MFLKKIRMKNMKNLLFYSKFNEKLCDLQV